MTQQHSSLSSRRSSRSDGGFTLPELLIVILLSGTLVATISMSISVMLKVTPQAEARLAESKDVTFLQTWIPVDLATAINSYPEANDAAVKADLVANPPNVSYGADLPGTNVLTLVVPNANTGQLEIIVYRYQKVGEEYQLVRYRIINPGTANESVTVVGVAHELPPPPEGWVEGEPIPDIFLVESRNQAAARPVGEDVKVVFNSGNEFSTGGAGLSAERDLEPNDPVTLPDPTAPPSRCGGRIAMVIDTSGSVPIGKGGIPTEQAAVGFIDAFVGTPTQISLNGFDRAGYGMINDPSRPDNASTQWLERYVTANERAPFVSVLDNGAPVDTMRNRITQLDDLDGAWPGGDASIGARDPNGDRVMWDQIGSGTNWEDGLFNVFFENATGQPYNSYQPDLVVFITDGQPSWIRGSGGAPVEAAGSEAQKERTATDAAKIIANKGRSQGARVIGIMVGDKSNNQTYVNYLKEVVGTNEWDGRVNNDGSIDVGNAVSADFFTGSFSQLGGVLRSIMIAECGGTVTVRKALESGAPATGRWTYATETGGQVLDADVSNSITFDFGFENDSNTREVVINEEVKDGYTFVRADCSTRGQLITDTSKVKPLPNGAAGVSVQLRPDEAVSCVMVSKPS